LPHPVATWRRPPRRRSFPLTTFTAQHLRALAGSDALAAHRLGALERFEQQPRPTTDLDDWRYSRIDDLELDRYAPVAPSDAAPVQPESIGDLVASLGEPALLVVVSDGGSVTTSGADPGVTLTRLASPGAVEGSAPPEPWEAIGSVAGQPDVFATLNEAMAAAPLLIEVAPKQVVSRPIVVVHWTGTDAAATFPRTVIRLAGAAEATVVEIHGSADVASLAVPVTELDAGEGATLRYSQIQVLGPRMWQIGHLASRVGRDASVTSAAVAFGGDYARLRTAASLVAPGGSSRQLAVYFGIGEQMHDFRTVQDHRAPRTTSDLLYKGVVANRSHSVYTGLIRVEKGAQGTNAYQTNRNLVLHEGAHADSVPKLEIEDNDVRCSHASAVGPISEDQRFYLESRGVPAPVADRLIALGFLDEVLAELPGAPGSAVLRDEVATKLLAAEAIERSLTAVGGGPR
jgi:Fe-S cluster assembly protein SufD